MKKKTVNDIIEEHNSKNCNFTIIDYAFFVLGSE